jgi:hypothetical protein
MSLGIRGRRDSGVRIPGALDGGGRRGERGTWGPRALDRGWGEGDDGRAKTLAQGTRSARVWQERETVRLLVLSV